jgi:hypothetical protein
MGKAQMSNGNMSAEMARRLFNYDPDTGILTWKTRSADMFRGDQPQRTCDAWNTLHAGKVAGCEESSGYLGLSAIGKHYRVHQIAFLIMDGYLPSQIDHRNMDRSDNRWINIRAATHSENGRNRHKQANNKSGFKGVSWHKRAKKWVAQIGNGNGPKYLGLFDSPQTAYDAYRKESLKVFGDFARGEE